MEEIDVVSLAKEVHEYYKKMVDQSGAKAHRSSLIITRKMGRVTPENARYLLYAMLCTYIGTLKEETHVKIDQLLKKERVSDPVVLSTEDKRNCIVWQGDITTLSVSAIVNACNSGMLGCFNVGHKCIDNIIHTKAGPRCREECLKWGVDHEPTGRARLTKGYNLFADYIVHTVGPIYPHNNKKKNEELLASCYNSCLNICMKNNIKSIAFCCLSTGEFLYPNEDAAHIALRTVRDWVDRNSEKYSFDLIVFNVFKDMDNRIYRRLFPKYFEKKKE